MGFNLIRSDEQQPEEQSRPSTTRIQERVLLDERVQDLRVPLAEAGFEVTILPLTERGTIPLRRPGMDPRPPILVTAKVRDWLERNPDPVTLGVSLINVAAIVGHPEGCAAVLLRAMADPNVPTYDLFWMEFSPDGRRHLMLFVREQALIRVTVDYGYDMHAIFITEVVFAQIRAGEPVAAEGQGFPVEGVLEQDRWTFNHGAVGAVHVFTDEGREVFEGDLGDDEVSLDES